MHIPERRPAEKSLLTSLHLGETDSGASPLASK